MNRVTDVTHSAPQMIELAAVMNAYLSVLLLLLCRLPMQYGGIQNCDTPQASWPTPALHSFRFHQSWCFSGKPLAVSALTPSSQ